MKDQDFDSVIDAFRESRVYWLAQEVMRRSVSAADDSGSLVRLATLWRAFASLTARGRIQFAAIAIAVASVAHLAIRELLPRYATSGLPWWWNACLAGFAALVALTAAPVAAAWDDSAPAKLWRRLAN